MGGSRLTALRQYLGVNIFIAEDVYQLPGHEVSITRKVNANLGQHAADDNFNMLIVYIHSLGAIYLLHLIHHVLLGRFLTQNTQDILWINRAIGKLLSRLYIIPALHPNMGASRSHILLLLLLQIANK